jgi:hypothetical protein
MALIRHLALASAVLMAGAAYAEEQAVSREAATTPPKGRLFYLQTVSQNYDWAEFGCVGYLWYIRGEERETNLGSIGVILGNHEYSLTDNHDKGVMAAIEADYNLYPTFNPAELDFSNIIGFMDIEKLSKPDTTARDGYFWAPGFKLSTGMYDDDQRRLYLSFGMYYLIHHDNRSMFYTYSIGMLF